jgi:hypothetical protein
LKSILGKYFVRILFLAGCSAVIILSSCKKDQDVLAYQIKDDSDVLGAEYTDTITMEAHTIGFDSVVSFNDGIKFIGSNQDPVFGRTDVSLYTKFSINEIGVAFPGKDLVSAEIVLAVKSLDFVGDVLTPLTYQVFEMNQNVPGDATFYSNPKNWYNPGSMIATHTCTLDVKDGIYIIRIPISNTYASAILNNPQYTTDNTTFQNTYKGFYITCKSTNLNPVSAQGAIVRIDLDNAASGLWLYYQDSPISTSKVTEAKRFPFSGDQVRRFNEFKHTPANGANNLLVQQLAGDSTKGPQALFAQGIAGTRIKFQIPYIMNFVKDRKVSVNQAEIRFKVDVGLNGSDLKYNPSSKLAIFAMDSLGRDLFTYDQLNSVDFARYGGFYDSENQEYVFNISRDIQNMFNGKKKNLGFYLIVGDGDRSYAVRRDDRAERVVIGGVGNALYKPVFKLTYTPYTND